jgi:hypothetical protein
MTYFPSLTKMIPISREDFAYDVIKEAILGGDLLPSQKISLTDLAKSLGVSIIPGPSPLPMRGRIFLKRYQRSAYHPLPHGRTGNAVGCTQFYRKRNSHTLLISG